MLPKSKRRWWGNPCCYGRAWQTVRESRNRDDMVLAIRLVKGTEHAMLDHVVLANGFTGSLPNDPVRAGRTGQASS